MPIIYFISFIFFIILSNKMVEFWIYLVECPRIGSNRTLAQDVYGRRWIRKLVKGLGLLHRRRYCCDKEMNLCSVQAKNLKKGKKCNFFIPNLKFITRIVQLRSVNSGAQPTDQTTRSRQHEMDGNFNWKAVYKKIHFYSFLKKVSVLTSD